MMLNFFQQYMAGYTVTKFLDAIQSDVGLQKQVH